MLTDTSEDDAPWEHAKPAKLERSDFPDTVEIVMADGIYVKKEGIAEAALNRIRRLAAFRNSEFYKAQAMGLPTYNKPRVIDTSEDFSEYLKIPRGCVESLNELLPKLVSPTGAIQGVQLTQHSTVSCEASKHWLLKKC